MPRIDDEQANINSLTEEFNTEMLSIFEREREIGLCSTRFLEGVRNHGGVGYAHRLLQKADSDLPKDTFSFLRTIGRLDLTAEYWVVQDRFRPLFKDHERDIARWRLDHGD